MTSRIRSANGEIFRFSGLMVLMVFLCGVAANYCTRVITQRPSSLKSVSRPAVTHSTDKEPVVDYVSKESAKDGSMGDSHVNTDKVFVRGYTRKDGTYVRPHYRSRPKSK